MHKLKGLVVALVGVAALTIVVPALGLSGPPVVNDHGSFTDGPYATNFCGVPGTEIDSGVWPGVSSASSRTRPRSMRSPSPRGVNAYSALAFAPR